MERLGEEEETGEVILIILNEQQARTKQTLMFEL